MSGLVYGGPSWGPDFDLHPDRVEVVNEALDLFERDEASKACSVVLWYDVMLAEALSEISELREKLKELSPKPRACAEPGCEKEPRPVVRPALCWAHDSGPGARGRA